MKRESHMPKPADTAVIDSSRNISWPVRRIAYWTVVAIAAVLLAFVNRSTSSAPAYHEASTHGTFLHVIDNNQYAYQARALAEGYTYLDLPVDEHLASLENPYDYGARYKIAQEYGSTIYWDYALYNGHYYCYFGVVPAVVIYLPYLLATGSDLSTPDAVLLLTLLASLACGVLIKAFSECFFDRKPPLFAQIVGFLMLLLSSNAAFLALSSRFYSVPLLASLSATFLALACWFTAKQKYKDQAGTPPCDVQHPVFLLSAGSFLMVLNFGCRPQFLVASLFALPIFWDEIVRRRLLFSKTGLKPTLGIVLGVLIAALPVCAFNCIRFGSPLNNGSFYNLTGFDMNSYVQGKRTTLRCLFYYLFQPIRLEGQFPWVTSTTMDFSQQWAPNEPMYGGIFFLLPFLLMVFLSPAIKNRQLPLFRIAALALVTVVLLADTRIAGVTRRYFTDFGYLIALVAIINVWALLKEAAAECSEPATRRALKRARCIKIALPALLAFSILACALITFSPSQYDSIAALNPDLYTSVCALFG